jgi:hypothetical protein
MGQNSPETKESIESFCLSYTKKAQEVEKGKANCEAQLAHF